MSRPFLFLFAALCLSLSATQTSAQPSEKLLGHLTQLTTSHAWKLVKEIPLPFDVHHPQGMVKIGDTFYISTVEVLQWPLGYTVPQSGYDRDTGKGNGYILKISGGGELLQKVPVGKDSLYHPGGIDFDGEHIWIPVCEYRPHGGALIYRMDPVSMQAAEMAYIDDSIGAMAADRSSGTLHGVNWGSRRHFTWAIGSGGEVRFKPPSAENTSFFVDLQDCQHLGHKTMVCTGHQNYRTTAESPPFRLGALEIIDTETGRPIRQIPVPLWTPSGLAMTSNPSWFEAEGNVLRAYFAPEDDLKGKIYVFEINFTP